ncbi:MAG: EpsG family protein [Altererythrobacter sp.]|nr:EpsG family protein [Altererythrobacter sp.]
MMVYATIYAVSAAIAMANLWKPFTPWWRLAIALVIPLSLFVGFRYVIGVDWLTYEIIFLDIYRSDLAWSLTYGDSAYSLINWLVGRLGGQVWHVNLICAAIFSAGLAAFCNVQRLPALAFAVLIPALVYITAMGYTRQATAIGCVMMAYALFRNSIDWRWLSLLVIATLFHKSAIIAFPLFIMSGSQNRWATYLIGGAMAGLLALTVVSNNLSDVLSLYFEGDLESSGTLPRLAIGAFSGLAFFLVRKPHEVFSPHDRLLRNAAVVTLVLLPAYFLIPSTTFVDRIGVLMIPFQGAILSGLIYSMSSHPTLQALLKATILALYGLTLAVWLLYATFVRFWVPYNNVLFEKWV